MTAQPTWLHWALTSAVCAAPTAVLAKVGIPCINADVATLTCAGIALVVISGFVSGASGRIGVLLLAIKRSRSLRQLR